MNMKSTPESRMKKTSIIFSFCKNVSSLLRKISETNPTRMSESSIQKTSDTISGRFLFIKAVNLNPIPDDKGSDKDKGIPAGVIVLIIIGSIIVVFAITFVIIHYQRKKLKSSKEIENKTKQLDSILE